MDSFRPIDSGEEATCKECGTQWSPLYNTVAALIENAACPVCGAQSYHYKRIEEIERTDEAV